jgi:hypothetical protein
MGGEPVGISRKKATIIVDQLKKRVRGNGEPVWMTWYGFADTIELVMASSEAFGIEILMRMRKKRRCRMPSSMLRLT